MKRFLSIGLTLALVTALAPSAGAQYVYPSSFAGITRAEFVRLTLQRVGGFAYDGTHCFSDVTTQSFAPAVCAAKQRGIITGNPNGTFQPTDSITFVEAAAVVIRAKVGTLGLDSPWYRPYVEKLSDWDAVPDGLTNITQVLTYSQASQILDEVVRADDDDDDDDDSDNDDDDILLSISASDTSPEVGDVVTFRIRIKNTDNRDADDLDVRATFDDEFSYVSSTDDGFLSDDDEVEWENIDVDDGETKTILLSLRVTSRADDGDRLRVEAEVEDSDASKTIVVNDEDSSEGDLRLSVTDSDDPVDAGDLLTYRISLENEDNETFYVDVRAFLDSDTDFVSASHSGDEERGEVDWEDIRLSAGQRTTLTLTVRVDSDVRRGDRISLRVEANEEEEEEITQVEDGDGDERVRISITEDEDPVGPGDRLTYRISIRNDDNDDISVDVRAFLDDQTSYLSSTSGGDLRGDDEVEWNGLFIREDQTREFTLTVRVRTSADDGDILRLRVEAGDDEEEETTRVED